MMLKLQSRIRDLEKERTELNKELENLKRAGRPRSDTQYSGTFYWSPAFAFHCIDFKMLFWSKWRLVK
mgnify:FL=1